MRSWLLALLITAAGMTDAAAQSCTPYPETFAQDFYRSSYSFFNESPEQVSNVVTPGFLRKLRDERACVEKHGHCHLQYDPWLGPQDGTIGSRMSTLGQAIRSRYLPTNNPNRQQ